MFVVNAVLLKLRPELYQSRHSLSSYVSTRTSYQFQYGHKLLLHLCQTNGHNLDLFVSVRTSYQFNTDTSSYLINANPMDTISTYMFQRGLAINFNTDTSSYLINAKPMGTILTHMFQRGLAINVNMDLSSYVINAKPMGTISAHMFQLGPNYFYHRNQSGIYTN